MIGGFGRAEVFSFHATKFFNTFEGGAITTHDDALAERLRLMRHFGFAGIDNVVSPGTNGKMVVVLPTGTTLPASAIKTIRAVLCALAAEPQGRE